MVNVVLVTESRFPINRTRIRKTVNRIASEHRLKGKAEVEVIVVGDRKMRHLNHQYRETDTTTNVLSFPLEDTDARTTFVSIQDGVLHLGMIFISYPQVIKEAATENKLVDDKIDELVEHGLLHLFGIHHE